jgi:uncharacterized protein YecE (DUF72 family)
MTGQDETMPVMVGTSGWQYSDWRGDFYPPGVGQARWLEHYAATFPVVENNAAFYRLPAPATFQGWRERTPDGFVMAVKASRYLTHVRRLRDPAEPVARLLAAAVHLGPRLGPILLQLPPTMRADPAVLAACLDAFAAYRPPGTDRGQAPGTSLNPGRGEDLPDTHRSGARGSPPGPRGGAPGATAAVRVAVEFRHESWWTGQTEQVLTDHGAALCWADRGEQPVTPLWHTADWGYLRLHEGTGQHWPAYSPATLRRWVTELAGKWQPEQDVFVFFNNDMRGAAPRDALAMTALAREHGRRG